MKKLYSFHWDCGRMGDVRGTFVADDEQVKAAIGKRVYFGEILGKHSEIDGTLEEGEVKVLTDDQAFIEKAGEYGIAFTGFNPLEYVVEKCSCGDSLMYGETHPDCLTK